MEIETFVRLGLDRSLRLGKVANGRSTGDIFKQVASAGDATYHPCPEAYPAADVPAGTVTEVLDWAESTVFPGTKRDIAVYAPAQLAESAEAPALVVFNDGNLYRDPAGAVRATRVLDTLNHGGEIPLTAAVFVTAGRPLEVPSDRELRASGEVLPTSQVVAVTTQRSDEYDRLTEDHPRFLLEEALPMAEELLGRPFTSDAALRAVCGISSGGIAAFNAAWHRPESFGAVISHCGSFANIQGGHEYPYLVRSTERKPIKVWMQGGAGDADLPYGNWPLANQQMAAALAYAGYEVQFEFGTGSHNARHGGAMLANTLRWLWGGGSYALA